ncbi:hypothetical protein J40TS1_03720 [Paenibacillus montaniterrae]|uniref:Uncharacterized protein n=1 Tax=Paenibacillus montaniterrae TaxID=429341 RepID=A0A919YJR7_9BACL|nr:hypothetical protein [Paenibacillus montaniterrae]GIP14730.1 hypothetical protein J40TS1_03720 [Paenibacillus montaniterrae]
MFHSKKSVIRYSGEKEGLSAVSSMLIQNKIDFIYHKENGGYIRTIDMVDNKQMIAMNKELAEQHPSLEIKIW